LQLSPADPLQEQLQALQRGGSSVELPVSQDGRLKFLVGFHALEAEAFSEAEQATLEALAELIGLTVLNHFNALASLYVAAEVAHDFAALRDFETGDHPNRVTRCSRLIAEGRSERRGLSAHAEYQIARFSRLHDIGKIGIPDRILLKQGPLTAEELQVMDTHVQSGLEMIGNVL
jgi:HD-GYP domain-containing protein (c-di-GMP phosphodiesterase class II)